MHPGEAEVGDGLRLGVPRGEHLADELGLLRLGAPQQLAGRIPDFQQVDGFRTGASTRAAKSCADLMVGARRSPTGADSTSQGSHRCGG